MKHLATRIRARAKDLGVESVLELSVAKQDAVRRGRVLDMALSRLEYAYLSGTLAELPETYSRLLHKWLVIESTLGFERVARDITPEATLKALRDRYSSPPSPSDGQEEAARGKDGANVSETRSG